MFRIAALNDSISSEGSQSDVAPREATKEAKEAEAFTLYGKALDLLRQGKSDEAEAVFQDLIDHEFLIEAYDILEEKGKDAIHPGLQLLYSIQKNLAAMATKRKDYKVALDCYLEAVKIDNSEVTVWYKVGVTALVLEDFQLAMLAFEQGLDCNPKHWPCLDNVISVLYALNNYFECLYYIARSFELDTTYGKGYALRNKIWAEQPSLKKDTEEFFKDCDPVINTYQVEPDEAKEYVEEALEMRKRNQAVCKPPEPERLRFPPRIKQYSWKCIGELLIELYDKATTSNPPLSLSLKVSVPDYSKLPAEDDIILDITDKTIVNKVNTDASGENKPDDSSGNDRQRMECDDIEGSEKLDIDKSLLSENKAVNADDHIGMEKMDVSIDDDHTVKATETNKNKDNTGINNCILDAETDRMRNERLAASKGDTSVDTNAREDIDSIDVTKKVTAEKIDTPVNLIKEEAKVKEETEVNSAEGQDSKVKEIRVADNGTKDNENNQVDTESKVKSPRDNEKQCKEECMEVENISEDSSSIQEALITAHALLNSLSPMKSESFPGCPAGPSPKFKSEPDTSTDVQDVNQEIGKGNGVQGIGSGDQGKGSGDQGKGSEDQGKGSEDQGKGSGDHSKQSTESDTDGFAKVTTSDDSTAKKADSQNSTGIFTKSSSYGFTVSNMLPEELEHGSKDITGGNVKLKESIDNKDVIGTIMTESDKSNILTSVTQNISCDSPIVIDSSSASQSPLSRTPQTAQNSAEDSTSNQMLTGSSVTSSKEQLGVINVTQSQARAPAINVSSPVTKAAISVTDHGYSRAFSEMPCSESTPKKTTVSMSAAGRSPGSYIVMQDSQSSASYIEVPLDIDDRSPSSRKAQKRKRPSLATEDVLNYGKRRSARVRNTGGRKKEEETVNFYDLLQTFLPSSLKNLSDEENISMETDSQDKSQDIVSETDKSGSTGKNSSVAMVTEEWNEKEMVTSFLDDCIKNTGLLDMCCIFLHILARHCKAQWCDGLGEIYMKIYNRVRKHMYIPNVFEMKDAPKLYQRLAQVILVQLELLLDSWLIERSKVTSSALMSPRSVGQHNLSRDDIPDYFNEDIWYLTVLCGYSDTLADIWIDHCIRVYWLKSRYSVLRNNMEDAVLYLDMNKEYLEYGKEEFNVESSCLPNCKMGNFVDLDTVVSQQELLRQTRSVEETEKLYEKKDYKKVVEILVQNFSTDKQKIMKMTEDKAERQAQLIMLQEALFETQDYKSCLLWGEEGFNECYMMSRRGRKSEETSSWIKSMITIFSYLQRVFEKNISASEALTSTNIIRFSQNLIRLIDLNMSLPESVTTMAVDTVVPWILLYYIIKQEEDKLEETRMKGDNMDEETDDIMSSSYMLLNIAHDYLGSRSWCTKSDGALLLFFMSVLKKAMSKEPTSKFQEEYQQAFEQCVYCLFGHPNKKGKAKHLQDHNASAISLQWEYAVDVFEYFKPKTLPEFDGYRSETISAEVEFLLKRITTLIPESSKTMGIPVDDIQSYIEGTSSNTPTIQDQRQVTLPVVDAIYYLLADYYLKNKEAVKAIKFYMQDLCMNPCRLDSWAGMALARMSQLDSKLASAELKMDQPLYKKSIAALRCFKRAVEIDDTNSKLWIEYGTLAYQLHSHASRQIRWKKWFAMDEETVKIAVDSKREMLQTATDCFRMAAGCDRDWSEDEWLHNYMLGKCCEKQNNSVKDAAAYYLKALECLHKEYAKYPKRIQYAYNTPHLAVEALEMYYRLHVIVLKYLLRYEAESDVHDYKLYVRYIVEAANTPFVKRLEFGQTDKTERDSVSSADESSCTEITPSKSNPSTDHTYFKEKHISRLASASNPVAMETENVKEQKSFELDKVDITVPSKSVTTLELHSEEQKAEVDITMATIDSSRTPQVESIQQRGVMTPKGESVESKADKDSANQHKLKQSPFSISSILGEKPSEVTNVEEKSSDVKLESDSLAGGESSANSQTSEADGKKGFEQTKHFERRLEYSGVRGDGDVVKDLQKPDIDDTEVGVRNVLSHIEDLIEEEMKEKSSNNADGEKEKVESMDVDEEGKCKNGTSTTEKGDTRIEDQINTLLKMSLPELHRVLVERCRQGVVLCLQRFPTHYKSHYRLAYIYMHSPYHKDLTKAHHILLGAPKWQNISYMPCQGLFGERKQTKFFQGIWKIPIDEIDRSGSFPSHLNRCIGLVLEVLRAQKDSQTLHQVHLQLNRQPEAGKKYLRDAEKKYYALTSHRYALDAVEQQIEDMRMVTDMEVRQKFLMVVYKIHEHGVHKLNKHVERSNRLLAEAYRVTVRKLETLPQKMLLDQAVRYCKQLLAQKSKKAQDSKSPVGTSSPVPSSFIPPSEPEKPSKALKPPTLISLSNIMKNQGASYSMQKAAEKSEDKTVVESESVDNSQSNSEVQSIDKQPDDNGEESDVIVLSDSSLDSSLKKNEVDKTKPASPALNTSAPTVKIKMGLLQAVKKLKPSKEGGITSGDHETSQDEGLSSALSEDESEAPFPSASDDQEAKANSTTSSTSSSSSSSSSSSEDESTSDENSDDANDADEDDNDKSDESGDEESGSESESDDNDGDEDADNEDKSNNKNTSIKTENKPQSVKSGLKVVTTTEDEEESSDNDDEIDLVSSNDEVDEDDARDKDYNASEDDIDNDIIMISDEEYAPKGKAVIPSPPHTSAQTETEVLVKEVPDFDPSLISGLIADVEPVLVGLPIVNKASANTEESAMEINNT